MYLGVLQDPFFCYTSFVMRKKTNISIAVSTLIIITFVVTLYGGPVKVFNNLAAPFFAEKVTPEDLKKKYNTDSIKVLIVPGHDPKYFGTSYGGVKEEELNNSLGQNLFDFLAKDPKFFVSIVRDKNGEYSSWFKKYIEDHDIEIAAFRDHSQRVMQVAKSWDKVEKVSHVEHNYAPEEVSTYLYGINKAANDYNIDIVIHIHFNDHAGRRWRSPGRYSGFSIYVPESQLPNSRVSMDMAEYLKTRLEQYVAASNLPGESQVIVPDQELIAVGANATRDGVSMLIEYGYIYEPQFREQSVKDELLKELAYQTYVGIKGYFDKSLTNIQTKHHTTLLPHNWENELERKDRGVDVLKLQAALKNEGLYPPPGKSLDSCPVSGYFGACTELAVTEFQEKYSSEVLEPFGFEEGTGILGKKTREKLNSIYNF